MNTGFTEKRARAAIMRASTAVIIASACIPLTACAMASGVLNTAYAVKGGADSTSIGSGGSGGSGKAATLPDVFKEKSDKFDDPQMSYAKIKAALSEYCTVYKLVIYGKGPDWEVRRNDLGQIERKITHREIYFAYKYHKDGKYYYNSCYFERQYEGGSSYGPPRAVWMTPTEIDQETATK